MLICRPRFIITECQNLLRRAKKPLQPTAKTVGETMVHIPKGEFKKDSHNPNARDAQN